ncbi:PhoU domain-containing protein [Rubrivirga sp. IMCC43871]|uniref:PhoU domain-containing protein n=1 Tax=Rubrivirga sp. IMCC43871 TaxID=3391575 RepID=UPI00398FF4F1
MNFFSFLTGSRPPLVDRALEDLGAMLDTADTMFAAATNCLLDNEALHVDLSAMDETINAGETSVRRAVLEHMVSDPKVETSFSLLLVSIVQDAERCGDLAKNIAKISDLAAAPRMGRHVDALRPIRDRVQATFPRVRRSFIVGDAGVGRTIMEEHDQTKKDVAVFLQEIASADDVTSNEAVVLAVGARMIGRTSSHLSNIVSAVALPFDQVRNSPSWD